MRLVGEVEIAGDVQIQVAVLVRVEKAGPCPRFVLAAGANGAAGHIAEGSVALVAIHDVGTVVVQVEVGGAVVVVICYGNAQPVARITSAGFYRDVREPELAVVSIECISGGHVEFGTFERRAVEKVDIDVPILIVVEQSQPSADGLHDVSPAGTAVVMLEGDAGLAGHVAKQDGALGARRGGDRHPGQRHDQPSGNGPISRNTWR